MNINIKKTILILAILGGLGYFVINWYFNKDFSTQTYVGFSRSGSITAIDVKSEDGKLKGKGIYFFAKSQKMNEFKIDDGKISLFGDISFDEVYKTNGKLFGRIEGTISRDLEKIECVWTNSDEEDATKLKLELEEETAEEIKNRLLEEVERRNEQIAAHGETTTSNETLGEKSGKAIDDLLNWFGETYDATKNSLKSKKSNQEPKNKSPRDNW
jgi:hypothetical protein